MDLESSNGTKQARMIKQPITSRGFSVRIGSLILIEGMRDARKLFRLFKSLMEYQKVQLLMKEQVKPHFKTQLNILQRLGFLFYWVFDNIQILGKVKFLNNVDVEKAGKRASFFWLVALVFGVIVALVEMYETYLQEQELYQKKKNLLVADDNEKANMAMKYY